MQLDLFKLHSKEDKPKGWIWVKFNPNLLRNEYTQLLKKENQKSITFKINKNLRAGSSTIEKHLIRLKNSKNKLELPLPIIIEITYLIKNKYLKNKIIKTMESFICKSSTTKQRTKAIKGVNETLAKLIGAHLADGWLNKNKGYKIKICDGRKELIDRCKGWVENLFGLKVIIRFSKKDNTWSCCFNNKIIARYFENILGIPVGKKAYIVKELKLIKNCSFEIRKAFASGFISFDGGIKATGMVSVSSMSKDLIDDLYEILRLDGININKLYNPKKKSWLLESNSGRDQIQIKKWLSYFERGTWKYERLKFFLNERKYSLIDLNYLFPKHYLAKVSLNEIYNSINTIKSGKITDISKELNKQFKVANTTIYKYLYILEKADFIYKTTEKNGDGRNFWSETIYNLKCQQ